MLPFELSEELRSRGCIGRGECRLMGIALQTSSGRGEVPEDGIEIRIPGRRLLRNEERRGTVN